MREGRAGERGTWRPGCGGQCWSVVFPGRQPVWTTAWGRGAGWTQGLGAERLPRAESRVSSTGLPFANTQPEMKLLYYQTAMQSVNPQAGALHWWWAKQWTLGGVMRGGSEEGPLGGCGGLRASAGLWDSLCGAARRDWKVSSRGWQDRACTLKDHLGYCGH